MTYQQTTGRFCAADGSLIAVGYSGNTMGLNNPASQHVPNMGPIPQGRYTIGSAYTDPNKGPVVMRLNPDPANKMFGRAGFLIHGDNSAGNHSASEGCIILPRDARMTIASSGDRDLEVIA